MDSSSYQFKKKSHEHQNIELRDTLSSAKKELDRVDADNQALLWRAQAQLDEGLKVLAARQKLIKIADRSEFGWATVKSDPLASDLEDEDLSRAEKEARKDAE